MKESATANAGPKNHINTIFAKMFSSEYLPYLIISPMEMPTMAIVSDSGTLVTCASMNIKIVVISRKTNTSAL